MQTIINLPHVGESVTEGVIGRWLAAPGQRVRRYDPLVEVLTDKVSMEVPSPFTGVLTRFIAQEGDTIPMGQPICEMDVEGAAPAQTEPAAPAAPASAPTTPSTAPPVAQAPAAALVALRTFEFLDSVRAVGPTGSGEGGQGRPDALQDAAQAASAPQVSASPVLSAPAPLGVAGGPWLSPLVRNLVRLHGVDVNGLSGTGLRGRITKADVERYLEQERRTGVGGGPAQPIARAPQPVLDPAVESSRMQMTPLRRTIAEHMARASREIPAAWTLVDVDCSGLVAARTAHRQALEANGGTGTYLPFTAWCVAGALRAHPRLNARWEDEGITLMHRVHLGIAASTEAGLIVPVVHDADRLGILDLARAIRTVTEAARAGKLTLEQVRGGTFTLNNTGALGSVASVPIINHPQAAILATEAMVKRPVVVAGDAIAVRPVMNLCLTFDHRICDGAEAAAFLQDVRQRIEGLSAETAL
jgi:2-oxoisovalerate dehydrogenase E2 component (dihydrolipoyl transacylase)